MLTSRSTELGLRRCQRCQTQKVGEWLSRYREGREQKLSNLIGWIVVLEEGAGM